MKGIRISWANKDHIITSKIKQQLECGLSPFYILFSPIIPLLSKCEAILSEDQLVLGKKEITTALIEIGRKEYDVSLEDLIDLTDEYATMLSEQVFFSSRTDKLTIVKDGYFNKLSFFIDCDDTVIIFPHKIQKISISKINDIISNKVFDAEFIMHFLKDNIDHFFIMRDYSIWEFFSKKKSLITDIENHLRNNHIFHVEETDLVNSLIIKCESY